MRWLIFLSRVSFLCGLFMLLAFSLLFTSWSENEGLASTVIMAGYGLSMILLPLTGLFYLILSITGRKPGQFVPRWLITCNIIMLLIFLIFTFYFNDPYYNQR
jgi:MFS family permease